MTSRGRPLLTLLGLALLAAPASASAEPVRPLTTSQSRILERGAVPVRVAAPARVFASVRQRRRGATRIVVSQVRDVRRRGVVRLRLNGAGRRELRGCSARTLVLTSVRGGRITRVNRALRMDAGRCRATSSARKREKPSRKPEQKPVDYETSNGDRCDWLDSAACLLPFPNDHFRKDGRLNLNPLSMPANREGKPIDPTDWNRNDGFSPGALIVTHVPGLDNQAAFDRTGAVPIDDMARSFDRAQPVVLINARTRERQLIWAEVDANPKDRADVNLLIRPGKNLEDGERYIVALRSLRDENGKRLPADEAFRIYRDRTITTNSDVEARRAHFEQIFSTLAEAGIDRGNLYRAWDFTVASTRNLSERMLSIRDDAFAKLGDTDLADLTVQGRSPSFKVTKVTENPEAELLRRVEGTVTVPCYLNLPGCPSGSKFSYGDDGLPQPLPGNTIEARFQCNIPKSVLGGELARPSLYGHGLLGSRGEVNQGQLRAFGMEHNMVFCATDWIGMACPDLPDADPSYLLELAEGKKAPPDCDYPNVLSILADMSGFGTLADRVQQGMLDFMYVGRTMVHPDGFNSDPAFQVNGHGVIDTTRLFYDGNSQGGIIGGALTAVEPDLDRAALGVPGMNYSTLLTRSSDWGTGKPPDGAGLPEYSWFMYTQYPNEMERPLIFSLIQTLWDRAEANGYANHMTSDPLPNTPPHQVLMHVGLGDHQVSQYAAEVEARTIGAYARTPWADPGRDTDVGDGHYGIPAIPSYPFTGSAIVLWDIGPFRTVGGDVFGTDPPPKTNTPPSRGVDPHEGPRREASARAMKSAFLQVDGRVVDTCGAKPCYAFGWTGP